MKKKKTYILGDGLKLGNKMLRMWEYKKLKELDSLDIYNPWLQEDINDKTKNPTAEAIFDKDTNAILESEVIVADVDNDSVGSVCEIGIIWGINYMLNQLHDILNRASDFELETDRNKKIREELEALLKRIPYKHVYWHCSDIRNVPGATETGLRRSYSLNQYLYGCLLDMAGDAKTFDQILQELRDKEFDVEISNFRTGYVTGFKLEGEKEGMNEAKDIEKCPTCNGSGGIDMFEDSIGEIVTIRCPDCGGTGEELRDKEFDIES